MPVRAMTDSAFDSHTGSIASLSYGRPDAHGAGVKNLIGKRKQV